MGAGRCGAEAYRAARGVAWAARGDGILVIDEVARRSETLAYPDAAVWDLACRGRSCAAVEDSLRLIVGGDGGADGYSVRERLERWVEEGWLEPAAPEGEAR
ncbi:MAG: hypothetical protein LBT74_10445 [Acidobacteriota bacterium]|jgi:hypothetical protein|nr:hypothetical protein [Acidobacteriota bacterium]